METYSEREAENPNARPNGCSGRALVLASRRAGSRQITKEGEQRLSTLACSSTLALAGLLLSLDKSDSTLDDTIGEHCGVGTGRHLAYIHIRLKNAPNGLL